MAAQPEPLALIGESSVTHAHSSKRRNVSQNGARRVKDAYENSFQVLLDCKGWTVAPLDLAADRTLPCVVGLVLLITPVTLECKPGGGCLFGVIWLDTLGVFHGLVD